jgi:hypothetical protein
MAAALGMNDNGTPATATTSFRPILKAFSISPVPVTIDELSKAGKEEATFTLRDIDAIQLDVYEFARSAPLPSTGPLLPTDKVPKFTTGFEPLMVVVPPS